LFSCILLLSSVTNVFTWWDTGHMLVSKIAELDLKSKNPAALQLAENITAIFNPLSHNKIKSFVESAAWPDDVKQYKLNLMDTWHYLDVPVRLDDPDPHPHFDHTTSDSAALLKTAMTVLLKWNKWELKDLEHEALEKSMMLRYLAHVVGDIHQPLHSAELFDDVNFPKGDMGGNLFKIKYTSNINNLHKFWDSGADSLNNNITRPLNKTSSHILEDIASEIMKEFPEKKTFKTKFDVNAIEETSYPFDDWILEANSVARNVTYQNIEHQGNVTQKYKSKAAVVCRQQISIAGFRLSQLVQDIYTAYEKKKVEEEEETKSLKFLN